MNYSLKKLLDVPMLQKLVASLDQISAMPIAIVDIEGSILVDMLWQDICAKFHHMNPITKNICLKCDQQIKAHLGERAETVYQCPLGLRHSIVPIIVEEKHLGNLLTGQHFSESPEDAFFIAQASQYGFNEDDYLGALRKVPLFSEETLQKNLNFIHGLTQMLAEQGLQNKRLQESRERRSIILQTAICGFWLADMQGRLLEVNEAYCQMSGYSEQELLTMGIHDLEGLERDEDTAIRIRKIKETGQDHFESRHRRKDGTLFDVEVNTQYQPFDGGQCVAFIQDITGRKQVEKLLLDEKALLRSVIDSTTDLIYFKDCNGIYIGCNKAAEKFIGLPENEQIGKSDFDFLDHEIAVAARKFDQIVITDGVPVHVDEQVNSPITGSLILNTVKAPIIGSDGQPIGLVGISRDITERKRTEEMLLQNIEQLRFVLEGSQLGFWDWNVETGEVVRNERWAEMLGYTLSEIDFSTNQWTDLIHPDDRERAWKSINDHLEGRNPLHENEYRLLTKDGQYKWILDRATIVKRDETGRPVRVCGTHADITDQKRAEEAKLLLEQQLQHTQKLESLGVLAGGIAHDFNNILAIIIGYCSLIKLNYQKAEKNIPLIESAAERAAGLCRQMMAYAGKAQLTKTKINMVEKVDEIVGLLKATLPQNAVIQTDLSAEIPLIEGDTSQLGQVVMNLIINSSEAIGTEQGVVDVFLSRIKVLAGKAYEDYHGKPIPPGEYVCLEVTDNGCGMDESAKWRIFEPFYTTKFTGRGLGMSAVLGIIKSHAGALQLFSKTGHGTTIKVYLPAPKSENAENGGQNASTLLAPWRGSGTILLAEDETLLRDIAKELLEMFGFTVLEAVNGKEALEIYQKNSAEITLVVTDMGMPVMDGYELFSELKKLNSDLPIIVSSGYGDAEVTARIGSDNIAGIISKPYNSDKLREVLKRVMEGLGG